MTEKTTYTIMINERQRQLILRAMQFYKVECQESLVKESGDDGWTENALESIVALIEMTDRLPIDNEPGTTNGFCI